jgi:hypothetical protein
MLESLAGRASERKLRLFACACCRQVWHLLTDERSRRAVEVAEGYADGLSSLSGLIRAYQTGGGVPNSAAARAATWAADAASNSLSAARSAVDEVTGATTEERLRRAASEAREAGQAVGNLWDKEVWAGARAIEAGPLADLLRDIIGNPLRPLAVDPAWLAWQDSTVHRLAQGAYEEGRSPAGWLDPARLAILADALEEAGCTDADLLSHLRGSGPHVRGCWVLDLLLGKQ